MMRTLWFTYWRYLSGQLSLRYLTPCILTDFCIIQSSFNRKNPAQCFIDDMSVGTYSLQHRTHTNLSFNFFKSVRVSSGKQKYVVCGELGNYLKGPFSFLFSTNAELGRRRRWRCSAFSAALDLMRSCPSSGFGPSTLLVRHHGPGHSPDHASAHRSHQ
jgi:hypothetical protein